MWPKSYICTTGGTKFSFDTPISEIMIAIDAALEEGKKYVEIPMYTSKGEISKEKFYVFVDQITAFYTES